MSKASITAFRNQKNSGKIKGDSARILKALEYLSYPDKEFLCIYLNLSHQTLTARLSELMDKGLVSSKDNEETKLSHFYLTPLDEQKEKSRQRTLDKIKRAVNVLNRYGAELDESFINSLQID